MPTKRPKATISSLKTNNKTLHEIKRKHWSQNPNSLKVGSVSCPGTDDLSPFEEYEQTPRKTLLVSKSPEPADCLFKPLTKYCYCNQIPVPPKPKVDYATLKKLIYEAQLKNLSSHKRNKCLCQNLSKICHSSCHDDKRTHLSDSSSSGGQTVDTDLTECLRKSYKITENLRQLCEFRKSNFFECHATKKICDDHTCLHKFKLNDQLEAVPENSDPYGTSLCCNCNSPMKTHLKNGSNDKNGGIASVNKPFSNNGRIPGPIKTINIASDQEKVVLHVPEKIIDFYDLQITKKCNNRTVPSNSFALRFQKGLY